MSGDPFISPDETPTRVFVSSTTRDLDTARQHVANALRARGFGVDFQTEFGAEPAETIRMILAGKIELSTHVVHLVGYQYGLAPAPEPDVPIESYTQMEARLAIEKGRPLFVFLLDESFPFDPAAAETEECARRQLEYRALLSDLDGPFCNRAADFETLEREVPNAIARHVREESAFQHRRRHLIGCLPPYPPNPAFVRREEALRRLNQIALRYFSGRRVLPVVLAGLGGIGKTNLALYHARRFERQLRPPLWLRASSPQMLARELARLAGVEGFHLDVSDDISEPERVQLVLQHLRQAKVWQMVLDNVDSEEALAEVRRLLGDFAGGHVIITSRMTDWDTGYVEVLELDLLKPEEATNFLIQRTAEVSGGCGNRDDALALAGRLGRLPLALEQAAAYLVQRNNRGYTTVRTFREYSEAINSHPTDPLSHVVLGATQYERSVRETWRLTIDELQAVARLLLRLGAWLSAEKIPRALLQADEEMRLLGTEGYDAALGELRAYSLVTFHGDSFDIHRLVQEVERCILAPAERLEWVRRLVKMLGAFAATLGDSWLAVNWAQWTALAPHVEAVLEHLGARDEERPELVPLRRLLAWHYASLGRYGVALLHARECYLISQAMYGAGYPDTALDARTLGKILRDMGQFAEAEPYLRAAVAFYESGASAPEHAKALVDLAWLLRFTGQYAEAEALFRRALTLRQQYGGPLPTLQASLAGVLRETGRLPEAEQIFREVLAGMEHETPGQVATACGNLAWACFDRQNFAEAEHLLRRALALREETLGAMHPRTGVTHSHLARVLTALGELAEAENHFEKARRIIEAGYPSEHPRLGRLRHYRAEWLAASGKVLEAREEAAAAVAILERSVADTFPARKAREFLASIG